MVVVYLTRVSISLHFTRLNVINSELFMQRELVYLSANIIVWLKSPRPFIVNESLVSLLITGQRKK